MTVSAIEAPPPRTSAPPLRVLAPALVGLIAAGVAIVAPAIISAHGPLNRDERMRGEALVRGRESITAAAGLAIAVWLVLDVGGALVRAGSARRRRGTRALAFLIWAVAIGGLKVLLDQMP